jgi:hypothetical protein
MCDYNIESANALRQLKVQPRLASQVIEKRAHRVLIQSIAKGRVRPGHDLRTGHKLPDGELARGHYMAPTSFDQALQKMNASPDRCQWCGGTLPKALVSQHCVPHDHREHIQHHFHSDCWKARLLAVAVVFGHVPGRAFLCDPDRKKPSKPTRSAPTETIIITRKLRHVVTAIQRFVLRRPSKSR